MSVNDHGLEVIKKSAEQISPGEYQLRVRVAGDAPPPVSTSDITSIPAVTGAPAELVAANSARKGLLLFNASTAKAYVAFSGAASLTDYTLEMGPGAFYQMSSPTYTGAVSAVWAAAVGAMKVTEL